MLARQVVDLAHRLLAVLLDAPERLSGLVVGRERDRREPHAAPFLSRPEDAASRTFAAGALVVSGVGFPDVTPATV